MQGGTRNWKLTPAFATQSTLNVYELTPQGRKLVGPVSVVDGDITLNPKANTAYVLAPTSALAGPQ